MPYPSLDAGVGEDVGFVAAEIAATVPVAAVAVPNRSSAIAEIESRATVYSEV